MTDLTSLVVEYLSAKGYTKQANEVAAEISGEMVNGGEATTTLESLLQSASSKYYLESTAGSAPFPVLAPTLAAEGKNHPERYASSFARFQEWLVGSLDQYKPELAAMAWPLFVHCYFKLVMYQPTATQSGDNQSLAAAFLERWGGDFRATQGAEMRSISCITQPGDLEHSDYAKLVCESRFLVNLSRISFELVNSFLASNSLLLLVAILNDHMSVALPLQDRDPHPHMQVARLQCGQPGTEEQLDAVCWGVLPFPIASSEAAKAVIPPPDGDKMAVDTASSSASSAAIRPVADRHEASVIGNSAPSMTSPLPDMNSSYNRELLEDLMLHTNVDMARPDPALVAEAVDPTVLFATFVNCSNSMLSLEMTKDATKVAAGFSDNAVRIWRLDDHASGGLGVDDGREVIELKCSSKPIYAVSWSPDNNRYLLSASADAQVRLWDVAEKRALVTYRGHSGPVWDVSFSPVGHYFVSASADRTARLWATDYVQPLRVFCGHYSDVTACTFHPNCNYVVTGSDDKSSRLWDVQSGRCLRVFSGHTDTVSALAICPSGRYLATASEDHDIRIYDISSGAEVGLLEGHEGAVHTLEYSAAGDVLASGGADGSVRIWDVAGSFNCANSRAETHASIIPTHTFSTKHTPVSHVRWTDRNLLVAGGAFDAGR